MDPQRWLDDLRSELLQRQLPTRYVTRLMRELSDHVTDGWENPMSRDAQVLPGPHERLGSPRQVAEATEIAFCKQRFAARHPIWTFGVFPPLLLIVLVIAFFAIPLAVADEVLDASILQTIEYAPWVPIVGRSFLISCIVLASVLVVVAFAGLAGRCDMQRRWPMTAAIVTAILCGCLWTNATPKTSEKMGTVTVGVPIPNSFRLPKITFPQLIQFVIPLGVAALITRRRSPTVSSSMERQQAA